MVPKSERIRWAAVALVATTLIVAATRLFRAPPAAETSRAPTKTLRLELARPTGGDDILKDEAIIRDLRPLFLPTAFNASLAEPRREPGRTILDEEKFQPNLKESEAGFARDLPPVATLNGHAANQASGGDVLAATDGEVGLVGFGRRSREVTPMPARGGFLEVVAVATGRTVLTQALPESMGPAGGKAWEPMELFAAVDAAGLAAPLVVTEGSRVEEVDAHFRKVLTQVVRIGDRLPPGFYRVVIGP